MLPRNLHVAVLLPGPSSSHCIVLYCTALYCAVLCCKPPLPLLSANPRCPSCVSLPCFTIALAHLCRRSSRCPLSSCGLSTTRLLLLLLLLLLLSVLFLGRGEEVVSPGGKRAGGGGFVLPGLRLCRPQAWLRV